MLNQIWIFFFLKKRGTIEYILKSYNNKCIFPFWLFPILQKKSSVQIPFHFFITLCFSDASFALLFLLFTFYLSNYLNFQKNNAPKSCIVLLQILFQVKNSSVFGIFFNVLFAVSSVFAFVFAATKFLLVFVVIICV